MTRASDSCISLPFPCKNISKPQTYRQRNIRNPYTLGKKKKKYYLLSQSRIVRMSPLESALLPREYEIIGLHWAVEWIAESSSLPLKCDIQVLIGLHLQQFTC